jgi:hypothetical protein
MAESDIQLASFRIRAEGVEVIDVIDTKYTKLGATMAKGQKRAEGKKKAMENLQKQLDKNSKSTTANSVKNIEFLAVTEAVTSASNQLVSSQYKRIDAELAAGEITEEQAAKERQRWKAREKFNASLEKWIALIRLAKVAQIAMTAARAMSTSVTKANTKAVLANTAAMLRNPWVLLTITLMAVVLWVVKLAEEGKMLTKQFDALDKRTRSLNDSLMGFLELIEDVVNVEFTESDWFQALTYGDA